MVGCFRSREKCARLALGQLGEAFGRKTQSLQTHQGVGDFGVTLDEAILQGTDSHAFKPRPAPRGLRQT